MTPEHIQDIAIEALKAAALVAFLLPALLAAAFVAADMNTSKRRSDNE